MLFFTLMGPGSAAEGTFTCRVVLNILATLLNATGLVARVAWLRAVVSTLFRVIEEREAGVQLADIAPNSNIVTGTESSCSVSKLPLTATTMMPGSVLTNLGSVSLTLKNLEESTQPIVTSTVNGLVLLFLRWPI